MKLRLVIATFLILLVYSCSSDTNKSTTSETTKSSSPEKQSQSSQDIAKENEPALYSSLKGKWTGEYQATEGVRTNELWVFEDNMIGKVIRVSNSEQYNGLTCKTIQPIQITSILEGAILIQSGKASSECTTTKGQPRETLKHVEDVNEEEQSHKSYTLSLKIQSESTIVINGVTLRRITSTEKVIEL